MNPFGSQLEPLVPGGYTATGPAMTEPTAWAAIALSLLDRDRAARRATESLAGWQHSDGVVPATTDADAPGWTTSLAMLAWLHVDAQHYADRIALGANWLLNTKGKKNPPSDLVGHNPQLVGWSWAADTHSWLEPTALATMALAATGYKEHPRTREAVRLLTDRLLPAGGANYGNTMVLGNTLLPHLQPSSIVLWALASQAVDDRRFDRTIDYLERELSRETGCASLAYAVIALTACHRRPAKAQVLLDKAAARPATQGNCYKLALLSLASHSEPLFADRDAS